MKTRQERNTENKRIWLAKHPGYSTEVGKRWRDNHPGKDAAIHAAWRLQGDNRTHELCSTRVSNAIRRIKAQGIMGGKCVRCGNDDPMVLEFNHRKGDGSRHRAQVGSGDRLVTWVLNNEEEAMDMLELLCANCHTRSHSSLNVLEGYSDPIHGRRRNFDEKIGCKKVINQERKAV